MSQWLGVEWEEAHLILRRASQVRRPALWAGELGALVGRHSRSRRGCKRQNGKAVGAWNRGCHCGQSTGCRGTSSSGIQRLSHQLPGLWAYWPGWGPQPWMWLVLLHPNVSFGAQFPAYAFQEFPSSSVTHTNTPTHPPTGLRAQRTLEMR